MNWKLHSLIEWHSQPIAEGGVLLTIDTDFGPNWQSIADNFWIRVPQGSPLPSPSLGELREYPELFASVIIAGDQVHLVSDHIRSWPIFFSLSRNTIHISDNINTLRSRLPKTTLSNSGAIEFSHAGFTTGSDTLIEEIQQVEAGTITSINRNNGLISNERYRDFFFQEPGNNDPKSFTASFESTFSQAMERMFNRANGRKLIIPLSAGADSRLLATWISRCEYPNVLTFTYGDQDSSEVEISRRVAERLQLPWVLIPYDKDDLISAWQEPNTESFLRFSWSGSALPHIQDWFAIKTLMENDDASHGDIVIPGHAMVGDMFDKEVRGKSSISRAAMAKVLADRHYSLLGKPEIAATDKTIAHKLNRFLTDSQFFGSPRDAQNVAYRFNHQERKVKYINNSVRTYEYFGLDWALPLHDFRVWSQFATGGYDIVSSRQWYNNWIKRLYTEQTGEATTYVGAAATQPTSKLRKLGHRAFELSGLLNAYTQTKRTQHVLNHPLRFDAFATGVSRYELAIRLFSGTNLLGIFAEQFLADKWVPGTSIFTNAQTRE